MQNFRQDFPFFSLNNNAVFFDTAASALKPMPMIQRITKFYSYEYANVNRVLYNLSANATDEFEKVREKIAKFINSPSKEELLLQKTLLGN